MSIYISHLFKTDDLSLVLKEYNLGIEVVNFGSSVILDEKERYYEEFRLELKEILDGREISFHGPFTDLVPASSDSLIRKVTKDRFSDAFSMAKRFNSKHMVYHTGYMPKTYGAKEWLDNSTEFWTEFTKDKLEDMEIHIENVYENDYALMSELIDSINHSNFSICLDIGHVNVNSTKTLESWIKGLNKRIKHVHLHNNYGIYDNHSGLQKGTIDMVKTLDLLETTIPGATWTLEIFDVIDLVDSLKFLKNYGFLNR